MGKTNVDLERSRQSWAGRGLKEEGGFSRSARKRLCFWQPAKLEQSREEVMQWEVGEKAEGQGWWVDMQGWRGIEEMTFTRL